MKYQIIPAINANTFEEVKEKIKLVEPFSDGVHLDVADATFTKNTLWHNPKDLIGFETALNIEVHLMIAKPEQRIDEWLSTGVKRIIFNLESGKTPELLIKKCRDNDIEVGISIGPDTSWTKITPFLNRIDLAQILAVRPGLAGQKFDNDSLDKIRHLQKECPNCDIEIDGGVNPETAKKAKEAGANIFVSASYIFGGGNNDIENRIEKLKKAVL